jgi:hypothetical protein
MHWVTGPSLYASGAITTNMPSMASLAAGKVLAVYAQSETGGNKLYSTIGDIGAGTWTTPAAISGYAGTVQGVMGNTGGAILPSATVASANPTTGTATAAWTSQVTGETTYRVWLSTYSNSTSVWSAPTQIGVASVSGLKITSSTAGGVLIGWLSNSAVNAGTQALNLYLVPATGTSVSDILELGASPYFAVKLGLSDANSVVAIWAGASQTVMLARKTANTWAPAVSLGTGAPSSEADLDIVVNADGSDAVAWGGVDPSIHTVVHDTTGTQIASQLIVQGSVGNARPSIGATGTGKYTLVFGASSSGTGSVLYYNPYSASYTPGSGWTTPRALNPLGLNAVGNSQLRVDTAGDLLAVILGYNISGFSLTNGASAWTTTSNIAYDGAVPAFVQEKSTGRGVILWCSGSQLLSAYFK